MNILTLLESAEQVFYKFFDDDRESFEHIAGYVSKKQHLIDEWLVDLDADGKPNRTYDFFKRCGAEFAFNKYGPFLAIPFEGNMFRLVYNKPIIKTPWDWDTPGGAGKPRNVIPIEHIKKIISQPTSDLGEKVYKSLGYKNADFWHDVIRNIPAHSMMDAETIINEPVIYDLIAKPVGRLGSDSGYLVYPMQSINW